MDQEIFQDPFQPELFYDSHSSTVGHTTQLTSIHFKQIPGNKVFSSFSFPICETAYPVFTQFPIHYIKVILAVNISLVVACVHCFLSFHCIPVTRVWLWLLRTFPVFIDSNESAHHPLPSLLPNHLILRLNKPSSLSLPSYIMGSWPSWWASTRLAPVSCSLSSPGKPQTGHRTPDAVSQVPNHHSS